MKAHRTPALALRQLTPGTSGLTCATVGEAEAMVNGGAGDVLVANEVVDPGKIGQLAALARRAAVGTAIDAPEAAEALGAAARAAGSTVAVLVNIDIGLGRCGVPGPAEAVKLGTVAEQTPGLRLRQPDGIRGRGSGPGERDAPRSSGWLERGRIAQPDLRNGWSIPTTTA